MPMIDRESIILVLGKHNIKTWAIRSTIRDVKKIYIHPDFIQPADADLAILQMYEPVEFSPYLRPVCLWNEEIDLDFVVSLKGTVVGKFLGYL